MLARATETSLEFFMSVPLRHLRKWIKAAETANKRMTPEKL
jgi:outer membrane biogenesis lipoprotein LolB